MSNKTLSNLELELTQKIQMHFPRGVITADVLQQWNMCSKDVITKRLTEAFGRGPEADVVAETILDFIGTVDVPARAEDFDSSQHFVVDTSKKAKVKISFLGDYFRENLLGKIEKAIPGSTLSYHQLKKWSRSIPIIGELGGDDAAESTLSKMFSLMEMQPNGESGTLLTNGYANIFFIRDKNGVLWTVRCDWVDGGWDVYAYPVDVQNEWDGGYQVFSRNPVDAQAA